MVHSPSKFTHPQSIIMKVLILLRSCKNSGHIKESVPVTGLVVAQRVGRGIALLFHDHSTGRGWSGRQHAPAVLYPWERPGTHCRGGFMGPRAGLDGRKISPHWDLIP